MDYSALKKLDEESMQQLQEGGGPADKCICNLLTSPEDARGIGASIRKALGSIGKTARRGGGVGGRSVKIPFTYQKGGHGIYSTRRAVKRTSKCGRCACDSEKVVLKDSDLSIRITTPDISSICPCPSDCLPDKAKLQDNIKVTIEYAETPDMPFAWNNVKSTKEQVASNFLTNSKERSDEKDSVKEEGASSTTDVKGTITDEEGTTENYGEETKRNQMQS